MADVKWIKITTDVFDDEKILLIESLPEADSIIVIWFKLLCLAGKQNNSGVFMMGNSIPYTDKMLATIFRRKEATIQLALQTFEQFGMIELIDGVITIPNWGKHQSLEQLEARREYQREYQREYRKKQKLITESESKPLHKHLRNDDVNSLDKNREEKNRKEKKEEKTYSADAELNDAILAFIDYRKKIKKPMTDRAVDLLIKKLNKLDSSIANQIEILNQSIVNGWQGIFPLKEEHVRKETVPSWIKKRDFQQHDYDFDELEKDLLGDSDPDFEERKEALQARLKEKYGKGKKE